MWRYLPPAAFIVGAMLILLAGAMGDAQSWSVPDLSAWAEDFGSRTWSAVADAWDAELVRLTPRPAGPHSPSPQPAVEQPIPVAPAPAAPAAAPPPVPRDAADLGRRQAARDALEHQAKDLADQIERRRQQLAALSAAESRTNDADLGRQQAARDALEHQAKDLSDQVERQQQELAALSAAESRTRQNVDELRDQRQAEEQTIARLQTEEKPAPAAAPKPHYRPPAAPAGSPRTAAAAEAPAPSAQERLMTARQALVDGRSGDALSLLETAQTQMVFNPDAGAINLSATWIGQAIRSLNSGNRSAALQAIDLAINSS